MKPITMQIQFQNRQTYVITLRSKTTLIVGDSASGKTTLIQCATDSQFENRIEGAIEFRYTRGMDIDSFFKTYPGTKYVLVDEESVSAMLREKKHLVNQLWQKKYIFLFIARQPITEIQYGYKDVYELSTNGSVTTLVPHFPTFNTLPECATYCCEDEGSGLQYFKNYVDVETCHGNRNWKNGLDRDCLILDGSAVGSLLTEILQKTTTLFLPISFEYLLLHYYSGITEASVYEASLIDEITLEQTCERLIADKNVFVYGYTKSDLDNSMLHARLIPEFKNKVDANMLSALQSTRYLSVTKKTDLRRELNSVLRTLGYTQLYTDIFNKLPEEFIGSMLVPLVVFALHDIGVKEFQ